MVTGISFGHIYTAYLHVVVSYTTYLAVPATDGRGGWLHTQSTLKIPTPVKSELIVFLNCL